MNRRGRMAGIVLATACLGLGRCLAVEPAATNFAPRPGTYEYRIRWQGLTAGKARVTIAREGADYLITSRAQTENAVKHLLEASYRGVARVSPDLRSREVSETRTVRGRVTAVHARYSETGSVQVTRIRTRAGKPVRRRETTLSGVHAAVDAFTAVLRARAIPWQPGRQADFDLLVGEDRYALRLTCLAPSRVEIDDRKLPAWKLQPTLRRLSPDGADADEEDREEQADTIRAVSRARVYVARDAQQDLLRILSDTALGDFDVILSRYRPPPSPVVPTVPSAGAAAQPESAD